MNTNTQDEDSIGTWLGNPVTNDQLIEAANELWNDTYGDLGNLRNATYVLHLSHEGAASVQLEDFTEEQSLIDGEQRIIWAPILSERFESPMTGDENEDEITAWQESYDDTREETITGWVEQMSAELSSENEAEEAADENTSDEKPTQLERIGANIAALDEPQSQTLQENENEA